MSFIEEHRSISDLNTLRLKGEVAAYAEVKNQNELSQSIDYARRHSLRVIPLGEGSNVVLGDSLSALIIRYMSSGFEVIGETAEHIKLKVFAGQNWHQLVTLCLDNGWYGLENLALIPGTVGAAPVQNIGAYGVELNQFVNFVSGIHLPQPGQKGQTGDFRLGNADCRFAYRDSIFKHELEGKALITSVELTLSKKFNPILDYPALANALIEKLGTLEGITPHQLFESIISIRQSKLPDPATLPNAGSFFKNVITTEAQLEALKDLYPELPAFAVTDSDGADKFKIPAAWLVEQCGFKGRRDGDLAMHEQQALVLVNFDISETGAYAADVLQFAGHIQREVHDRFGLWLEIEPQLYQ